MPETIALPTIEKPAGATPPASEPAPSSSPNEPLRSPIAHIVERALEGSMMNGEPTPKPAEPIPTPEPTPAPVPAKAPEFELPPEITGTPEVKTDVLSKVEDLIPEAGPEWAKTEKQKQDIKRWRDNQIRLEQSLERAEGELKKRPEANGDADARIQALEQRNLEMSNIIEELGINYHPAFKEKFLIPKAQAIEGATQLLKDLDMDPKMINRALEATGRERIEALDDLADKIPSQTVKIKVLEAIAQVEQIEKEQKIAESDRENFRQTEDQRIRAQRHQEAQVQLTQIRGMVDAAVEGLRDQAGFTVLKKIDGNEKWNTHLDGLIDSAKKLMTETTNPMELAANAVLGQLTPLYFKAFQSEQSRRIAAEKELAEARGATPGLGGNGAGAGAGDTTTEERTGIGAIVDRITKAPIGPFGG